MPVLSTLFSAQWIQNTGLYKLLWRKLTSFQPKPLCSLFCNCCTAVFTLSKMRNSNNIMYVTYMLHANNRSTAGITDGLSFGQQWVCFGASCNWLCLTWGQLLVSYRSHPWSPSMTRNLSLKQIFNLWNFQFFIKIYAMKVRKEISIMKLRKSPEQKNTWRSGNH